MKRYRNIFKLAVCFILCICFLLSSAITGEVYCENSNAAGNASQDHQQVNMQKDSHSLMIEPGMTLIAENDFLELYIDKETTVVAVKNKKSGKLWYTNPPEWQSDTMAANNTNKLRSQLNITYADMNGAVTVIDNYAESIEKGQYEIKPIQNGIKVVYTLGNASRGIEDIPRKISNERFQKLIFDKADEKDQKVLKRRFSHFKDGDVWIRREINTKEAVTQLLEILDKAGYTQADLAKDNLDNGIPASATAKKAFTVPLEYWLDKENMVVQIPMSEVQYPEMYPIIKMDVLEFYGAAHYEQGGYLFIPDGSGAIINFGLTQKGYKKFFAPVYGVDKSILISEKKYINEQVLLPVYGIKQEEDACFAMIEDGDALANIQASKAGLTNSYNTVFSNFDFTKMDAITLGGSMKSGIVGYQKKIYDGNIRIRYAFLSGNDANYTGMAHYYQNYLVNKYKMERMTPKESIPFCVETIGAIDKIKSFLGIRYYGREALTTYKENIEILKDLQGAGVNNIKLRLSGWFNKGMNQTIPINIRLERKLGGASGFKKLVEYAQGTGVTLYPDATFMTVAKNNLGFFKNDYIAKTIDDKDAESYYYNTATYGIDKFYRNVFSRYILAPRKLSYVVDKFIHKYKKYDIGSVSLNDLGNEVHSDFNDNNTVDRQSAFNMAVKQVENIKNSIGSIMLNKGSAVTLPYADFVVNAPGEHSWYNIEDERVPFYQMVLHGYIEYVGQPINLSSEYKKEFLRAIELGSGMYFKWMYQEASAVKGTDHDFLFSINYKDWFARAVQYYKEANEALKDVQDRRMTGHSKMAQGVYKTDYEGSISIIVNYNKTPVDIDGVSIEAEGFKMMRGGK